MRRTAVLSTLLVSLTLTGCDDTLAPTELSRTPDRVARITSSTGYPVTVMSDLGNGGHVNDVDSHGHAVGSVFVATGGFRAVLWAGGRMIDLGVAGSPNAINDAHEIVGTMNAMGPSSFGSHPFRIKNGELQPFMLDPFSAFSSVLNLNASGQMAGHRIDAEAFRIRPNLTVEPLYPPTTVGGGTTSGVQAVGINDAGEVVGSTWATPLFGGLTVRWGVKWAADGTPTDIGPGEFVSINASGEFVGADNGVAVRGTSATDRTYLFSPMGGRSAAYDVNDHGYVVGSMDNVATIWAPDNTPTSLGVLDELPFSLAFRINNNGWIAGVAGGKPVVWGTESIPDGDFDGDGAPDSTDNCVINANPSQVDGDGDGIGVACDPGDVAPPDFDGDGVIDTNDNCPAVFNPGQADVDGDGVGDACDPLDNRDADGDGLLDANDNCPAVANPSQSDLDDDGPGDACDPPTVASLTQALQARVQALVAAGVINHGNGNALLTKLAKGNFQPFINQVNDFEASGKLTAAQAAALRARAQAAMGS